MAADQPGTPPGPPVPPVPPTSPVPPPVSPPPPPPFGPPPGGPGLVGPGGPGPGGTPPGPPRRSRWPFVAVTLTVLALVVSLVALLVSWRALDQANDARDIAKAGGGGIDVKPTAGAPRTTAPTGGGQPTPDGGQSAANPGSSEEPVLNQQTRYTVRYEKKELVLRLGCDRSFDIDLDKPEVNVDSGEDLKFNARCGGDTSVFELANSRGAQADTPTLNAVDCNDRIERAPLGPGATVPARKAVVICVRTSLNSAVERGDTWKMVLLEVTGASSDGTVTVAVTAWDIPH